MFKRFQRRIISIIIIVISLSVEGIAFAEKNIEVYLDGKILNFDVQPQLIGGRTMVPLRKIFESMGATVNWNNNTQTVTAFNESYYVTATINDSNIKVNGETNILDMPPLLVGGRILVPARFVAEAFGAKVGWDEGNQRVIITTNDTVDNGGVDANTTTFSIGEYLYKVPSTWKQKEGDGTTYFYPSGTAGSENGVLMVQSQYAKVGDTLLDEIYDEVIEGIKGGMTNYQLLEQNDLRVANTNGRRTSYVGNIRDNMYQFETLFLIQNDTFYSFMLVHPSSIPSILIDHFNKIIQSIVSTNEIKGTNSNSPTVTSIGIKSANELENYLKDNFGELRTELKTFDLKNSIQIIENQDKFKCYDIAIVISWSDFESDYYNIRNSIKYTDKQIKMFEDSIKTYLKSMADAAISAMPTKKLRGGFLQTGYKYPNLKIDYYENTIFGWKNYDYSTSIFPYYEDTNITKFHWHDFSTTFDGI